MKNIKDYIIEGAWGYEPLDNDGALDLRDDIYLSICELIYDKCLKNLNKIDDQFSTDYSWEALGNIEYFFEEVTKMESFKLNTKNDKSNKYYFWFHLIDKKNKNIFDLYKKLLDKCVNDEEWQNGWKDIDKMKKSLEKRKDNYEDYKKLLDLHNKKEQERKNNRYKAAKLSIGILG